MLAEDNLAFFNDRKEANENKSVNQTLKFCTVQKFKNAKDRFQWCINTLKFQPTASISETKQD